MIGPMLAKGFRRILVVCLALVLSVGLAAHFSVVDFDAKASAVTAAMSSDRPADMPMQGKCDGCGGHQKAPAACAAFCASLFALPTPSVALEVFPAKTEIPFTGWFATGFAEPPDPHPPRTSILS